MKALVIVCRSSVEPNVRECLDRAKVGFTMIDRVSGRGATGEAPTQWVPTNVLFLVVAPDDAADGLAATLRDLESKLRESHGAEVPLRVFGFPCEALVG